MFKRLIGSQQQLLAGLTTRVEGSRHLNATERTIGQQTAIFACERHSLRNALIDNIQTDLGEAMNIRFSRAKIATLYRIVEQAEDAVSVVLIVLGGVNSSLRCDAVRPARGILEAKAFNVIPEFTQCRCSRSACEAASDNDNVKFWPVIRSN